MSVPRIVIEHLTVTFTRSWCWNLKQDIRISVRRMLKSSLTVVGSHDQHTQDSILKLVKTYQVSLRQNPFFLIVQAFLPRIIYPLKRQPIILGVWYRDTGLCYQQRPLFWIC